MTRLLTITGICLLFFAFFEILFAFIPFAWGNDGFWIFTYWMLMATYGVASLCQILMFEPPTSEDSPTTTQSNANNSSATSV
jgi:hypothetical protein